MLYIRVDANPVIATGHMMRCLSLAEAVRELGEDVVFITADDYPVPRIREAGFKALCLDSQWDHMESELPVLREWISGERIRVLLLDSYQVTDAYLNELNAMTRVVYLDDLRDRAYPVSGVIQYSFANSRPVYEKWYGEKYRDGSVRFWEGYQYIPLRREFRNCREHRVRDCIRDILITTGGSDTFHAVSFLMDFFLKHRGKQAGEACVFHITVGRYFDNLEELKQLSQNYPQIQLYENFTAMSELMEQCDLAISAGGATLFELCACGIPSLCFTFADNQIPGSRELERLGMLRHLGDFREGREAIKERLAVYLQELENREVRHLISRKMQRMVDGKGALRLAGELIQYEKDLG